MSARIFSKTSTKWKLLGGVAAFFVVYALWVTLWSMQGLGLKKARIGLDACAHCGMQLSDPRFVVSALDKDESGNEMTIHFDDIGCFFDYSKKHHKLNWVGEAYDLKTREALNLTQAFFQKTTVETPMGSGWIALKKLDNPLLQKRMSDILQK